jgi:hypothetical protein
MQYLAISPISCNPMCFHIHDGKRRNHPEVKAPISPRQKAPLLVQEGRRTSAGVVPAEFARGAVRAEGGY